MKTKVLLVDDRGEFRKLVQIFLSTQYEVETAENGFHAMLMLQNGYKPDIIVSDLMMPEVDGKTFVGQLKASGVFKHIPIIILSSIDKSSERIELFKSGISDYLVKPFNPEELNLRIANLLKVNV